MSACSSKKSLYLDICCRYILAAVFLFAGVPKFLNPTEFSLSIGAYGMLPDFLLFPAALFLSLSEIILAIGLIFGKSRYLLGSIAILLLFIAVLSYAIYLGLDIDCGCFGPEDPEAAAFSGIREAIVRDFLLLFCAITPLVLRARNYRKINENI